MLIDLTMQFILVKWMDEILFFFWQNVSFWSKWHIQMTSTIGLSRFSVDESIGIENFCKGFWKRWHHKANVFVWMTFLRKATVSHTTQYVWLVFHTKVDLNWVFFLNYNRINLVGSQCRYRYIEYFNI